MGAVLNGDENCKQSLLELKDKIGKIFHIEKDEGEILYLINEAATALEAMQSKA